MHAEQRTRTLTPLPALKDKYRMYSLFQVDELIQGLQDLGCLRTRGEDQTLCVLSDSFDNKGDASSLQASGDLPPVDVVKVMVHGRLS